MQRLVRMVAALLFCLMAGQPVAAALIAGASPGMACCRKGKGAHACCKRKAISQPGPLLTTGSQCGADCCCNLASATEKPFAPSNGSPTDWPMATAQTVAWEEPNRPTTSLDRTQWQRPPPPHSWL